MKLLRPGDDYDKLVKWLDFLRYCQEENTRGRHDPSARILSAFLLAVALAIGCALLLLAAGWSPGEQDEISAAYRAQQHDAVLLADKPSIEIRP